MTDKIKSAFDEIKAEQELKTATKYFLYEKYNQSEQKRKKHFLKPALVAAFTSFAIIVSAAFFTYSVPVSAISVDSDTASVELEVNRFDKVVRVTCFGETPCVEDMNLKNMNYKDAVSLVLENTEKTDSSTVLTVSCKSSGKCEEIAQQIRYCHSDSATVNCHSEDHHGFSSEAHSHGISTGKYNAYLTLKELDPEVTLDEIKALSMKEIRERINAASSQNETASESEVNITENAHHSSSAHTGNGRHHTNHGN